MYMLRFLVFWKKTTKLQFLIQSTCTVNPWIRAQGAYFKYKRRWGRSFEGRLINGGALIVTSHNHFINTCVPSALKQQHKLFIEIKSLNCGSVSIQYLTFSIPYFEQLKMKHLMTRQEKDYYQQAYSRMMIFNMFIYFLAIQDQVNTLICSYAMIKSKLNLSPPGESPRASP